MNIEGAIFDLDGTLLDSMDIWDSLGETYLFKKNITPAGDLRETLKALSLPQAARHFREHYGISDDEETIIAEVTSQLVEFYRHEAALKDGVVACLAKLKGRQVKMCIATASERELVEAALKRLGVLDYFSGILTTSEVRAGKDSPLIFQKAVEKMGVSIVATVVFEDALHAVETAVGAGFRVVGVHDDSAHQDSARIKALTEQYIYSFSEWKG